MRLILAAALILGSVAVAAAQVPPGGQQYDVPDGSKPQTIMIAKRDILAGQNVGRHIHHGVEMTFVGVGEVTIIADGMAPHVYHAGESFVVPREVPHDAKNTGSTTATIYVTYVIDKGTPPRVPVP